MSEQIQSQEVQAEPSLSQEEQVNTPVEETISKAEYDRLLSEKESLEAYKNHATRLITNDYGNDADRWQSTAFVMREAGYNDEDINNYIQFQTRQSQEASEEVPVPTQETLDTKEVPMENNNYEQLIAQQQEEIQRLRMNQERLSTDQLKDKLTESIDQVYSSNPKLKSLLTAMNRLGGEDADGSKAAVIKREIEKEAMNLLNHRKNQGGKFDFSWFNEETNKAAEAVVNKFRTVIGDPDQIMKAPETATEQSVLLSSKPVETPSYQKGDTMSHADTKLNNWTNDVLNRLVQEDSAGGKSKA